MTRPASCSTNSKKLGSPEKAIPHLDLVNFDAIEFDNSHYVLTSPRSLEACARVGVKPVELLYKSLDDFKAMYPALSSRDTFDLYDENESIRKERLRKARLERERIIDKENENGQEFDELKLIGKSYSKQPSANKYCDVRQAKVKRNGVLLKEKDAKILDIMKSRQLEDEQRSARIAEESQLAERQDRAAKERERRTRETRSAMELRRREQELDHQAKLLEQAAAAEIDQELRAEQLQEAERKADARVQDQRYKLASKELSRQREFAKRQARSTHNLKIQEEAVARYHDEVLRYSEEALSRASAQKLSKELADMKRKRQENEERRRIFLLRKQETQKNSVEETNGCRESVNQRHAAVRGNQNKLNMDRQRSITENREDRLRRERANADRRELIESEVADYREELRRYTEESAQRAESIVNTRVALMAARTASVERERLMHAKQNKQELDQAELAWSSQTAHLAKLKSERVGKATKERERRLAEMRMYNRTTEAMREDIRRQNDTFDKKVQQVNLVNQLGLGW